MTRTMTESTWNYIEKLNEVGLVERTERGLRVSEDVIPLINAVHHVLAGGKVRLDFERRGNPETVARLDEMFKISRLDSDAADEASDMPAVLWP